MAKPRQRNFRVFLTCVAARPLPLELKILVFWLAATLVPLRAAPFGASAIYPHLNPKHVALQCSTCHSLELDKADIHEMPGHATCAACHNFATEGVNRTERFCGECHNSTDASKDRPALFDFPKHHDSHDFGDLFSHVDHRNAGTATRCEASGAASRSQCADCHAAVRPEVAQRPDMRMEASHTFCFVCHCENPSGYSEARKNLDPARKDCSVCHVPHEAQLTSLTEVKGFLHADHVFDTRPRRKDAGPVSHDPDVLCLECHRTAAESHRLSESRQPEGAICRSCHTGKVGLPDVLPADTLGPLDARR
jgi:hypothetical protein